jgi:hypothetical protein
MRISGPKLFGPAARRFISPDRWTDHYPSSPEYAKELDVLLSFADNQGRLHHSIPRLESKNAQRDETLDELRVAYLLHHSQFPVVQWEPPGLNGKIGEYLIDTPEGQRVFVEVKSPGWEGELSDEERCAGRAKQPKYRQGDGGAFGNWHPLQRCVASPRTYPKFSPTQPNLLIVADDLKMPLLESLDHVEIALYADHNRYGEVGYFTSARFENLGGVGVFRALSVAFSAVHSVEYEFKLFDNPFALPAVKLPDSLLKLKTQIRRTVRGTVVAPAA